MHRVLVFSYDVTVGITLGTKSVKLIWKGCDIKSSTCRPCGRIKISSLRKMDRVQNHWGLMRLDGCVCLFDGVLFDVSCSLIFSLGHSMFDFVVLLSMNRDGVANNIGP